MHPLPIEATFETDILICVSLHRQTFISFVSSPILETHGGRVETSSHEHHDAIDV
jgi:hypothetical protein